MTWRANISYAWDGVELLLVEKWGDKIAVGKLVQFTMKEQDAHSMVSEPTLRLPGNQGQELLQALWDAGLRPSDGSGSGAEANALKAHIKFAERMADGLLKRAAVSEFDEHG